MMATADELSRAGIVRRLSAMTARRLREPLARQTLLSASVIRSRIAPSAGAAPARNPIATISATPIATSRGGSTKIGSMPPVGSPCCTNSQASASPSPPPSEHDEERFGQDEQQDRAAGEPERLEHRQLAGALAHRLRHGARGDEAEHEEHDG